MRTYTNNKKEVVAVMRGQHNFTEIVYKNILFKYETNNLTYRECYEIIKEKITNPKYYELEMTRS